MKKRENTALSKTSDADLDIIISDLLHQAGMPAHVKGYYFAREAIRLSTLDMGYLTGITKILYPAIAKCYKTTPSRVERAIRHAIAISWERGNLETSEYFMAAKPTNSEFIALLSDRIRLRLKVAEAL